MQRPSLRLVASAAIGLIILVATATTLLEPFGSSASRPPYALDRDECVMGEAAINPRNDAAPGLVPPSTAQFSSLEEAERYLCVSIPRPKDETRWRALGFSASRSHDLDTLIEWEGERGNRMVHVSFVDDATGARLDCSFSFGSAINVDGQHEPEKITIQGEAGFLWLDSPDPGVISATWRRNEIGISVISHLEPQFTRDDFLRALETIE